MCKNEIQIKYEGYELALDELVQECKDRGIYIPEDVQEVIDDLMEDRIGK